ncbi:MAG: hypothetical protein QOE66_1031, partial [Chloroflexota bacterium]|nr:hypothetical protein [Chloroflexota bacterium]
HGLGTGATIAVRSAAFSDVFGGPNFGTIFGLLAVAYPVGGALAVYLGAAAFDATGSYLPLVPLVLVAVAIWSLSLWVAGPRRGAAYSGTARRGGRRPTRESTTAPVTDRIAAPIIATPSPAPTDTNPMIGG